jgi:hypothetical protein
MALLTLEGIYKEGKLEFTETDIQVPAEARVLITFLPATLTQAPLDSRRGGDMDEREALRQQAFAQMEAGISLGGHPYPKREELYQRPTPKGAGLSLDYSSLRSTQG